MLHFDSWPVMDDAVLVSTMSAFFSLLVVSIIICLYSEGQLLDDFRIYWCSSSIRVWSVQGRLCKVCVYIFIYVCIYNIPELLVYWILGAVHSHSLGLSSSTHVTWPLNSWENRGWISLTVLHLLQVVPFFFPCLRSLFLCSSLTGGSRLGWIFPVLSSRAPLWSAAWKQTCSREWFLQRVNVPVFIAG